MKKWLHRRFHSVTIVWWKDTAFPLWRAMVRRWNRNVVSLVFTVIVVMHLTISCVSLCLLLLLGRIACTQCIDTAYCYRCRTVSLCVGQTDILCNSGWTDRDAVWDADSCGSKDGVKIGRIRSQLWGVISWRCGQLPNYWLGQIHSAKRLLAVAVHRGPTRNR